MTDLSREVDAWCQSYVTAFSAYAAPAIGAHWQFPALILRSGRSIPFNSQEQFDANTGALLQFYRAQGVACAKRKLIDCFGVSQDTAAMRVSDEMVTGQGALIVFWEAAYVLNRVNGIWKAVLAVADGELDAWTARGTPLGG